MNQKGGLVKPYSNLFSPMLRAIDILIIGGLFWLISLVLLTKWIDFFTIAAFITIISYMVVAEITGLYGSWRFTYVRQEILQVFITWFFVLFILLVVAYGMKVSALYSRRVLMCWAILTPFVLALFRLILRKSLHTVRGQGRNSKFSVIVGAGEQGQRIATEIQQLHWLGMRIVGFFDDVEKPGFQPNNNVDAMVIGNNGELLDYLDKHSIDMVFIALPMTQETKIQALVNELGDSTVQTFLVPDLFISDLLHTRWGYVGNIPILGVHDRPFTNIDGVSKRIEDILLSSLILLLISLPMLIIALLIKLTSKGPVLFKQTRYGLSGDKIKVWKFRSMTVCEDGNEISQATQNDSRITAFGQFLRKTSLDELPQFFNVLQGTMSIVGPRPHAVAHNEEYRKEINGYMLRHTIKPGITGWAQVNGWRGETDTLDKMEKRIEHDLWYIKNWTLWLDIKIIVITIFKGFVDEKAY